MNLLQEDRDYYYGEIAKNNKYNNVQERLALGEETICATRVVKEAVRLFGSVTGVPVTKSLIACSRKAHADYVLHLEKEDCKKN